MERGERFGVEREGGRQIGARGRASNGGGVWIGARGAGETKVGGRRMTGRGATYERVWLFYGQPYGGAP